MTERLPGTADRPDGGRRRGRTPLASVAGLLAVAVVAIPVAISAVGDEDVEPESAGARERSPADRPAGGGSLPTAEPGEGGAAIPFRQFPLDRGWKEVYGRNAVDGPSPGSGGISMPEGHCEEEVLFGSGYQDKLSTYVRDGESSLTREILGYASARAARSTFRALGQAVAGCPVFDDSHTGEVAYAAEVYEGIDEANARTGVETLTFAYTSTGSAPFGVLYQFAVIDEILYGSSEHGEWTAESARDGAAALDEVNAPLTALVPQVERPAQ